MRAFYFMVHIDAFAHPDYEAQSKQAKGSKVWIASPMQNRITRRTRATYPLDRPHVNCPGDTPSAQARHGHHLMRLSF